MILEKNKIATKLIIKLKYNSNIWWIRIKKTVSHNNKSEVEKNLSLDKNNGYINDKSGLI